MPGAGSGPGCGGADGGPAQCDSAMCAGGGGAGFGDAGAAGGDVKAGSRKFGLGGMAVDEGRGKVYLLQGRQVLEASLSPSAADKASPIAPADTTQTSQPLAKPTAAP